MVVKSSKWIVDAALLVTSSPPFVMNKEAVDMYLSLKSALGALSEAKCCESRAHGIEAGSCHLHVACLMKPVVVATINQISQFESSGRGDDAPNLWISGKTHALSTNTPVASISFLQHRIHYTNLRHHTDSRIL